MSREECVTAEMCQMDTASLCTLCLLETKGNVFENFSSSFSPDIQTSSSLNSNDTDFTTLQQSRLNCIEKNMTAGYAYVQSDREILDNTEAKIKLNNNEVFHWTKMLSEKNNDSESKISNSPDDANNVDGIPKSCGNFLKLSEKTFQNNKTHSKLSSQKNKQDTILQAQEPSSVFSFSRLSQSISFEIGILPRISQTIIDRVLEDMDNDLIQGQKSTRESCKFDKHLDEQQQVSVGTTTTTTTTTTTQAVSNVMNNEKVHSTVQPSAKPIENFQLTITNEKNCSKKVQFYNAHDIKNVPSKEMLKRDKKDDVIGTVTDIPKKKPKIITQEVLKFPVRYLALEHERLALEHSRENIRNNECPVGTEDFQKVIKRLQIPRDTTKSKRHITDMNNGGADKFTKIHEENVTHLSADRSREKIRKVGQEMNVASVSKQANPIKYEKSLPDSSERAPPPFRNPFPQKILNLSMLHRQISENSKHLINQAEEMKRLRSSIDELRECLACQETKVAATSRRNREKVKEFVTRSTQTTDPHPIIIDVDDSMDERPSVIVQEPNRKSLETENKSRPTVEFETDTYVRNWFHPIVLKNSPDVGREADTSVRQVMPEALSAAPEKVDIQISMDKVLPKTVENQQSNSAVQYDPYYNPLRPRRWSRYRNNQSKSGPKNRFKGNKSYFPPLPIVIGNKKSTNVTK